MNEELKRLLANTLVQWIHAKGLNQKETSKALGITQPRVSNLMHCHLDKFSTDALLGLLSNAGYTYKMTSINGVISLAVSPA